LSISLILSIIALADVGMASASPTISIVPASITGLNQGDTFSVDVTVDPEGQPVRVVEISLKFDPAVVQVDGSNSISCNIGIRKRSSEPGDFWGYNRPLELLNVINNTNGTLHLAHVVGRSRTPEITTSGTYAILYLFPQFLQPLNFILSLSIYFFLFGFKMGDYILKSDLQRIYLKWSSFACLLFFPFVYPVTFF